MRRLIIDTDTASDDAVAIMMALREPAVKVEAITVVAGNVPLDKAVRNALLSVEMAGTYSPPVYAGLEKPLIREQFTAEYVHGEDGMGDMGYQPPEIKVENENAVDAMLRIIHENSDSLELVTLGPLTNVAAAIIKDPKTMQKLKRITIMGGTLGFPGNVSVAAEFNIFVDAEAADIVLKSGVPVFLSPYENCLDDSALTDEDISVILGSGSPVGRFAVECNRSLKEFVNNVLGKAGLPLADPATMALVLYPECVAESFKTYICVETKSELTYGQIIYDFKSFMKKPNNATIFKIINGKILRSKIVNLLK